MSVDVQTFPGHGSSGAVSRLGAAGEVLSPVLLPRSWTQFLYLPILFENRPLAVFTIGREHHIAHVLFESRQMIDFQIGN